jgi:hypothetical protein
VGLNNNQDGLASLGHVLGAQNRPFFLCSINPYPYE